MYKLEKTYPTGGSANSRCRCAGRAVCGVHSEICRSRHNAYRHIRTRLDVGSDRDVQLPERIPVLEGSRRTGWTCSGGCASRIWRWRPLGDSLSPDAELAKRICQSGNGILPTCAGRVQRSRLRCREAVHCREANPDCAYGDTYAGGVGAWAL